MQFNNTWQALLNPGGSNHYFATNAFVPFKVNASGFSVVNAWWLSELCRLIYKKDPEETGRWDSIPTRNDILNTVHLQEQRFFNTGKAQCAIITSKKEIKNAFTVLVFRGTSGKLGNWIHNFNAFPGKWPRGGWVHKGFRKVFDGIWDDVHTELLSINRPIFYTGHSLGAAMATLAASFKPPQALYTFGSPRVGNADFINSLKNIQIYRVINGRDIVSSTPPSLMSFKFLHAGVPYYLHHKYHPGFSTDRLKEESDGLEEKSTSTLSINFFRWFPPPPKFLSVHAPINYTTCLRDPL
jgi:triacylglycerol lipase